MKKIITLPNNIHGRLIGGGTFNWDDYKEGKCAVRFKDTLSTMAFLLYCDKNNIPWRKALYDDLDLIEDNIKLTDDMSYLSNVCDLIMDMDTANFEIEGMEDVLCDCLIYIDGETHLFDIDEFRGKYDGIMIYLFDTTMFNINVEMKNQ